MRLGMPMVLLFDALASSDIGRMGELESLATDFFPETRDGEDEHGCDRAVLSASKPVSDDRSEEQR